MKVIYFIAFISLAGSDGLGETRMYSDDKNLVSTRLKECATESGVTESVAAGSLLGQFENNSNYKKFLLCMNEKFGLQDAAGAVQKDALRKRVNVVITNPEWLDQVTERCAVERSVPAETAWDVTICYYYATHPIAK